MTISKNGICIVYLKKYSFSMSKASKECKISNATHFFYTKAKSKNAVQKLRNWKFCNISFFFIANKTFGPKIIFIHPQSKRVKVAQHGKSSRQRHVFKSNKQSVESVLRFLQNSPTAHMHI